MDGWMRLQRWKGRTGFSPHPQFLFPVITNFTRRFYYTCMLYRWSGREGGGVGELIDVCSSSTLLRICVRPSAIRRFGFFGWGCWAAPANAVLFSFFLIDWTGSGGLSDREKYPSRMVFIDAFFFLSAVCYIHS